MANGRKAPSIFTHEYQPITVNDRCNEIDSLKLIKNKISEQIATIGFYAEKIPVHLRNLSSENDMFPNEYTIETRKLFALKQILQKLNSDNLYDLCHPSTIKMIFDEHHAVLDYTIQRLFVGIQFKLNLPIFSNVLSTIDLIDTAAEHGIKFSELKYF